jgi:hypothetical protein
MRARLLLVLLIPALLFSEGCSPQGVLQAISGLLGNRQNAGGQAGTTTPGPGGTTGATTPSAPGTGLSAQQPQAKPQPQAVDPGSGIK